MHSVFSVLFKNHKSIILNTFVVYSCECWEINNQNWSFHMAIGVGYHANEIRLQITLTQSNLIPNLSIFLYELVIYWFIYLVACIFLSLLLLIAFSLVILPKYDERNTHLNVQNMNICVSAIQSAVRCFSEIVIFSIF